MRGKQENRCSEGGGGYKDESEEVELTPRQLRSDVLTRRQYCAGEMVGCWGGGEITHAAPRVPDGWYRCLYMHGGRTNTFVCEMEMHKPSIDLLVLFDRPIQTNSQIWQSFNLPIFMPITDSSRKLNVFKKCCNDADSIQWLLKQEDSRIFLSDENSC